MRLTNFEKFVLQFILEREAPELLSALRTLEATSRSSSGSGCYVNFACDRAAEPEPAKRLTLGKTVFGAIAGMKYGVGFMVFVNDGKISTLEVFSHADEKIPVDITDFNLSCQD